MHLDRRLAPPVLAFALWLIVGFAGRSVAAERSGYDRAATAQASPAAVAALERSMADPTLAGVGRVTQVESRYAVPTFLWATGSGAPIRGTGTTAAPLRSMAEAARTHLGRVAPFYRLDGTDVQEATLSRVHDTGRGAVIATLTQVIDGVEVFRDAMNVMMDRRGGLVAVSGYLPSRTVLGHGAARAFRLSGAEATARALEDFTGLAVGAGLVRSIPGARGGYQTFELATGISGLVLSQPLRAKQVWFHLPQSLMPAYYVEVLGDENSYSYVIAAEDGEVLFRHDLVVSDSYAYRVWADPASPYIPWEGPQGTAPSPHPTGVPDLYNPPFVAPNLVTLQNGPISTNDPWLAPGATQTNGNNVDAYADLFSPDGFSGGDLRATTTGPNAFDRIYDTSISPSASSNQRMASVTQLFFMNNFLHDWFYDAGFDETAGNAQASNYGRGGVEGDRLLAEAQDFGGTNNANMSTPADGGGPRMQMYVFNRPIGTLTVSAPAPIAGSYLSGTASFGPQTFSVSGTVVAAVDGAAPSGDACSALVNAVAGKIVLIDRSTCTFVTQVLNAQTAGAIGAIIVDSFNHATAPSLSGSGSVTIPVLSVTLATGTTIKAQLGGGVTATMTRATSVSRDGTIDNMIVAHEWGHYISNRLVGNGGGLSTQVSGGMGEGWGDFHALLMTARAGENFNGVYPIAPYALTNSTGPMNAYYFGIRRYPYSTDMTNNPLTFKHIQNGVPLPVGPPVASGSDGISNAEVHRTGEVWCAMLWECYAALLNDSGRLTFSQAQQRMTDYLVAAYKMTPNAPTFTEARDALLSAAAASDPADLAAFWAAFAKRGAGTGAISPDRNSLDNIPVVESFVVGGNLAVSDVAFNTTPFSCDGDAYVDNGEVGELSISIRNTGATALSSTVATVTSTNPAVSFPDGNVVALAPTGPSTTAGTTLAVRVSGAAGVSVLDFQVDVDDPGLLVGGPRIGSVYAYGHADEEPSATLESFEAVTDVWTYTGDASPSIGWGRRGYGPTDRRLYAFDPGVDSDASSMTPPLVIGGLANFKLHFDHAYRMESTFDGGVIEISNNGGASWTDIGGMITSGGYTGIIVPGSAISGRSAWTGVSPGYPALTPVTVDLGMAYAGQTVRVRFRAVTDGGVGDEGWSIATLVVEDNQAQVFPALIAEPSSCGPLAVGDGERPAELAFALAGANPVSGPTQFRFALPFESDVSVAIYDVIGRRVALLADGFYEAGVHTVAWNPAVLGTRRSAGVYFARMSAGDRHLGQRVIVMP